MTRLVLIIEFMFLAAACGGRDNSPEGAARRFIQEVENGNAKEAFQMLAPPSQEILIRKVLLANAQAGGGHRFQPEDLLAVGQLPPLLDIVTLKVFKIEGNKARIQIASLNEKVKDLLELVQIDGAWRVVLPKGIL